MISELLIAVNYQNWLVLGIVLVIAEILLPSFFLLWLGLASLALSMLLWLFPDLSLLTQILLYSVFTFSSIYLSKRFLIPKIDGADEIPNLNRRGEQHIGMIYLVHNEIINGQGKVKVGDSLWNARGPNCAQGQSVKVVGIEGTTFLVEPVENGNDHA